MKKVGLALSGGTAKGFAHIGVLEILEKNKIPIDYIAGTSMGAAIGALYSSGYTIKQLKEIAKTSKWVNLVDFTLPDKGVLSGDKVEKFLRILLMDKKFSDLKIPMAIVAADIYKGEKVIFKQGDVASALRASISIPSIFVPYRYNKRVLVDGGIIDPVPVDVVRDMGADIVIAVDLSTKMRNVVIHSRATGSSKNFMKKLEKKMIEQEVIEINKYMSKRMGIPGVIRNILIHPEKITNYLLRHKPNRPEVLKVMSNSFSIMSNELSKYALESADFVIKPKLDGISNFDFGKIPVIIGKGSNATKMSVRKIKRLIK